PAVGRHERKDRSVRTSHGDLRAQLLPESSASQARGLSGGVRCLQGRGARSRRAWQARIAFESASQALSLISHVNMRVSIFPDSPGLGGGGAGGAAARIRSAVAANGQARVVAATGTSQIAFLEYLTRDRDVDWSKVEVFHLDEYVGLPESHPAS